LEQLPSFESMNRLSTLNEMEEINYEHESIEWSESSQSEELTDLRVKKPDAIDVISSILKND
jgi:hypothetical protein